MADHECVVKMAGLDKYMTEDFLLKALQSSGEDSMLSVKVFFNEVGVGSVGYSLLRFASSSEASNAIDRLNGKMIPNSRPPARYKLSHHSSPPLPTAEKAFSVWVSNLSLDVNDEMLFIFFSSRFNSVISAKVIRDVRGTSKGIGFIRFENELELQSALSTMQGIPGLGTKNIKLSVAVQKKKDPSTPNTLFQNVPDANVKLGELATSRGPGNPPLRKYNQWSTMAAVQEFNKTLRYQNQTKTDDSGQDLFFNRLKKPFRSLDDDDSSIFDGPANSLVEHTVPIDYKNLNRQYFKNSNEFYEALAASTWGVAERS